ncbi:MAG: sialate O-acetylesterase [Bacteroidales bacterium 45-6]|uniref:sialate O-acetylesterase n=1 Tax=uncultured Dysgonomonas sp. TaxID=206096 RepID=UPI000969A11B|nr:sialate O-acetylesterase [uncultured Dysgonomonas sp.]OJU52894.1 MAG: sialate O-acetylesterase [Bacteroidales bacterium 45-6]
MKKNILSIVLCFFAVFASAQTTLPKVFGDSMVLQRNIRIPVWGTAAPGSLIVAQLGSSVVKVKTNETGKWMVRLPKFKAGGPYTLTISEAGKQAKIQYKGILIGDVWIASGQSNMDLSVKQAKDAANEIAKANYPQMRFLVVAQDVKLTPQNDILSGKWKVCDPTNVKNFSAVAYYFARKIHLDQNVPIGIVQPSRGGTPVEAWTSREKLLSSPITRARTLSNDTLTPNHFVQDSLGWVRIWDIVYHPQNNSDKIIPSTEYDYSAWPSVEMPRLIKDFGIGAYEGIMWMRKKVVLSDAFAGKDLTLNIGHPEMNYSLYFNGVEICRSVWNSSPNHSYTIPAAIVKKGENTIALRIAMMWGGGGINPPAQDLYLTDGNSKLSLAGSWKYQQNLEPAFPKIFNYQYYPTVLYNSMIHPLIPFGIKGFLWYQGEANDSAAYNYRKLFPMMISDWRTRWGQDDLPFLFVQLPNYKKVQPQPVESEWAELREAQTMTLSQPNTGMACTIDVGDADNIHPVNKQEVGRRLALIAEKQVYNQNVIASGPMLKSFSINGGEVFIRFSNVGSGLKTSDGKDVAGFAIAGDDKKFYWAKATIKGDQVVVSSDKVANPVAVRYAWADNPVCNLINSEGLPAVPFRTDNLKGITQK